MSCPNLLYFFHLVMMYIYKLFLYCSVWEVMTSYIERSPMDLINQSYSLYNIVEYTNKRFEYKECMKSLHLGHEGNLFPVVNSSRCFSWRDLSG
jgi:hypothetical protein